MKKKYLFVGIGIILLVLGLTAATAVKNSFKKAFQKSTQLPTPTPEGPTANPTLHPSSSITPQVQVPKNSLPVVCQQNYNSPECTQVFNELVKNNCHVDINIRQIPVTIEHCVGDECKEENESPAAQDSEVAKIMACVGSYYRQLGQIACSQDNSSIDCQCSKDSQPLLCLLNKLTDMEADKISKNLSNLHLTILCPMKEAFDQTLGFSPFENIDCSADYPGKQTTAPQTPQTNNPHFGLICSQNPSQEGCLDYCYQHRDTLGCPSFLANYCAGNFGDPICIDIICTHAPNLCALCDRFPAACEQILQRSLGL